VILVVGIVLVYVVSRFGAKQNQLKVAAKSRKK